MKFIWWQQWFLNDFHIVRHPKKVEPYLILIFTKHHVKNIKWSEEFVDQTIDLPIKQWILGCAIFELDLYQKQQTHTQANERSSIFTIYAILVTYPLLFGPELLLWSSWMLGGNSGGLLGWQLAEGEFLSKSRELLALPTSWEFWQRKEGGPSDWHAGGNMLADQPGKALGFISIFWVMVGISMSHLDMKCDILESHFKKI